ncbi:MAG: bifunctional nuclease family protein [Chloroflexota bacterium]
MAVQVIVDSVRINLATETRVVLLKDTKIDRYLLIHIGEWESYAIVAELHGQKSARPFTHDLLQTVIDRLGAKVTSILVHSLRDEVFFASLFISQGDKDMEIDARPSDSIALAVRCDAPIFVEDAVFDQAGFKDSSREEDEEKLSVFRDFVNQLDF